MARFDGKVAFITGAAVGIGRAIALRLSREGCETILTDIDLDGTKATADEIHSLSRKTAALRLDVTRAKEVEEVIEQAWRIHGRIDFLINNAGVSTMKRITDLTEEDWDLVMNVNAKGVFLVTKAMLGRMMRHEYGKDRPKIVNIASKAGKDPGTLLAHYAASKHAVVGLTRAIARELASEHICVNCVCPGLVETGMQEREIIWESKLRGITTEMVRTEYLRRVPLGRLESPEDVAGVVAFLCSHDSDYMTGQALNVDGGMVVL